MSPQPMILLIVPTESKNKDVNHSVVNSRDQELMVQCTVCSTIEDKLRYSHQELKKKITEKFSELEERHCLVTHQRSK